MFSSITPDDKGNISLPKTNNSHIHVGIGKVYVGVVYPYLEYLKNSSGSNVNTTCISLNPSTSSRRDFEKFLVGYNGTRRYDGSYSQAVLSMARNSSTVLDVISSGVDLLTLSITRDAYYMDADYRIIIDSPRIKDDINAIKNSEPSQIKTIYGLVALIAFNTSNDDLPLKVLPFENIPNSGSVIRDNFSTFCSNLGPLYNDLSSRIDAIDVVVDRIVVEIPSCGLDEKYPVQQLAMSSISHLKIGGQVLYDGQEGLSLLGSLRDDFNFDNKVKWVTSTYSAIAFVSLYESIVDSSITELLYVNSKVDDFFVQVSNDQDLPIAFLTNIKDSFQFDSTLRVIRDPFRKGIHILNKEDTGELPEYLVYSLACLIAVNKFLCNSKESSLKSLFEDDKSRLKFFSQLRRSKYCSIINTQSQELLTKLVVPPIASRMQELIHVGQISNSTPSCSSRIKYLANLPSIHAIFSDLDGTLLGHGETDFTRVVNFIRGCVEPQGDAKTSDIVILSGSGLETFSRLRDSITRLSDFKPQKRVILAHNNGNLIYTYNKDKNFVKIYENSFTLEQLKKLLEVVEIFNANQAIKIDANLRDSHQRNWKNLIIDNPSILANFDKFSCDQMNMRVFDDRLEAIIQGSKVTISCPQVNGFHQVFCSEIESLLEEYMPGVAIPRTTSNGIIDIVPANSMKKDPKLALAKLLIDAYNYDIRHVVGLGDSPLGNDRGFLGLLGSNAFTCGVTRDMLGENSLVNIINSSPNNSYVFNFIQTVETILR